MIDETLAGELAERVERAMPAAWAAYIAAADETDDHPSALRAALAAAAPELCRVRPDGDARERLASHLYVTHFSLSPHAEKEWDAGEVSQARMDDCRRAADRALAAITGTAS